MCRSIHVSESLTVWPFACDLMQAIWRNLVWRIWTCAVFQLWMRISWLLQALHMCMGPSLFWSYVHCFAFSSLLNCVFHVSTAPTLMMILEYHYNCLNKFGSLARIHVVTHHVSVDGLPSRIAIQSTWSNEAERQDEEGWMLKQKCLKPRMEQCEDYS